MLSTLRDRIQSAISRLLDSGHRQLVSPGVVSDNVHIAVHDVETLREEIPEWDDLDREARHRRVREVDPEREIVDHNTVVDGLLNYLVDNLDPSQSASLDASHLEIGSDSTTASTSDSSMVSTIGTFATSDDSDNGKDLFTSTFLDTGQANGNDIKEAGLTTASSGGTLLNRSTFAAITKTDSKTVTIDVTLEFRAA